MSELKSTLRNSRLSSASSRSSEDVKMLKVALFTHSHSKYGLETQLKSLFYLFVRLYAILYFSIMRDYPIAAFGFNRSTVLFKY